MVDLGFIAAVLIRIAPFFVISFEQFENLLELELTHFSLELFAFNVLAVDQIMDFLKDLTGLFLGYFLMCLFVGIFFE